MKNTFYIFIILSVLLPFKLFAQKEKPNNYIGLSAEAGFSNLFLGKSLPSPCGVTPWFGGGGGGAFFYELEYKKFLFRTGFGIDFTTNDNRIAIPKYTASIAEYPNMTYHYSFTRFNEKTNYGVGYIPVMVGGNFDKLFFLVGAKIGVFSFAGSTQPFTNATIWAEDKDVIDPMENLYTHYLTDYSYAGNKSPLHFNNINIMGSFEIGLNLNSKIWKAPKENKTNKTLSPKEKRKQQKPKLNKGEYYKRLRQKKSFKDRLNYRISLFADFGVNNLLPANLPTTDQLITFKNVNDITPRSIYNYSPHQNAFLNNLLVGVKLAIQYEIPHKVPKKGDMATPYIVTFVKDENTDKPIAGATVTTQAITNSKKTKKPVVKTTDAKHGRVAKAYVPGEYRISVARSGYIPQEPFTFVHKDQYDTIVVALHPQQILRSQAIDAQSGRSIEAQITVYDEMGNIIHQKHTDSLHTTFSVPLDDRKQYSVCAIAQGYYDTCMQITNFKEQVIQLEPVHVKRFVLKNMFFATDKTKILSSSEPALMELYSLLQDNPNIRIRIIGHTDDVGKDDYNQRLSEGRSASVKQEMINRGINPNRIETIGHGEKDPIVPNDSDEHRQMNRRVEIEILE